MDYFLSDAFGARAEALLAKYRVPGLAVAITLHGRIEARAFGLARLPDADNPDPVPCTPDTLFDIASASKSMTAAAVALLVDDPDNHPDVRYDAAVSALLPGDFVMPTDELTRDVTLDDILSHRTGMPTHDWSYLGIGSETPDTPRSVTRNLRNLPVCAPLRTKYMYNNMMYTVAAHLVEQRTGLPFADFLAATFFAPLGMTSTSLQPARARARARGRLAPRMASGYTLVRASGRHAPVPMVQCPEADGAGSIITSVRDYARWVDAMLLRPTAAPSSPSPLTDAALRDGPLRPRTIVDPHAAASAPSLLPHSSPALYCAGLEEDWYRGHRRLDHGGGVTGFAAKQTFLPASAFGCVVAANSSEGGHAAGTVVARELIDEVLGVPAAERPDWEALVDRWEAENEDEDDPDRCEAALVAEMLQSLSKDEAGNDAKANDDDDDDGGVQTGEGGKHSAVPHPLTTSLETYAGTYEHPGYHQLVLEIKDGDKLFVDASDRSFGFTGVFNHVADQRLFTLRIAESEAWGGQDLTAVKAEFRLDGEGGKVSQLGIAMEPEMKDTDEEMIWFTRK